MIRSLLGVVDLARDATLAVGAYVGILREHVKTEWATVLGGSFDDRVAQARARMEAQADMLADKEAEEEVSEPRVDTSIRINADDSVFRSGGQRIEVIEECPTEWWPNSAVGGHKCGLPSVFTADDHLYPLGFGWQSC